MQTRDELSGWNEPFAAPHNLGTPTANAEVADLFRDRKLLCAARETRNRDLPIFFRRLVRLICPTGQISSSYQKSRRPKSSPRAKNIYLPFFGNMWLVAQVPARDEGRYASSRTRARMRWTHAASRDE
jgi:hypothetical protein